MSAGEHPDDVHPRPDRSRDADPAWPPRAHDWRHDHPDPPLAFEVPTTPADGLLLAAWTIVAQFVILLPLGALGVTAADPDGGLTPTALVAVVGVQLVTLLGAVAYLRARRRLSWRLLGPVRPERRQVLTGVGVGIGGYVLVVLLLATVQRIVGPITPPDQAVLDAVDRSLLHTALTALVAVVLAPIVEEFVFRGVLFQSIKARLGLWPGMGLSAFAFGAAHLFDQPLYIVVIAILGFWLAGALHRTGSLVVPIAAHATFNAVQLLLVLLVGSGATGG